MGILDVFKIKKFKEEIKSLQQDNLLLNSMLTPEHKDLVDLLKKIDKLKFDEEAMYVKIDKLNKDYSNIINDHENKLSFIKNEISHKSKTILVLDEQIMLESFSLYEPRFNFTNSSDFKERLELIRSRQKELIKQGTACTGNSGWTVNNSKSEGKKMVNDMIKLVLRSFNNECDSCVANVKFNNIDNFEKRIITSHEALTKLGRIMNVHISQEYFNLKLQELRLSHEYQIKKQEEKEEQKQIREQMREDARLQKEIEEAKKTVEKEQKHYINALSKITKQLETCTNEEEKELLKDKINEITSNLVEIDQQLKNIDYREANQRAGYVYVISNIGSFGDGVYKIGMTRRLDPYDRVSELGDASVPFNFDVHAMIFSDDAPKLESVLHKEFEHNRINFINKRREYFRIKLEDIEKVIKKNHDQTIEFVNTAAAEEYRETSLLREQQAINEINSGWATAAVSLEK